MNTLIVVKKLIDKFMNDMIEFNSKAITDKMDFYAYFDGTLAKQSAMLKIIGNIFLDNEITLAEYEWAVENVKHITVESYMIIKSYLK